MKLVKMLQSHHQELPDCFYLAQPILITPSTPTPNHFLYLSNLDDQNFLRFSIKYLYLYKNAIDIERLKSSLSRVLVDYYPLAGRLRRSNHNNNQENDDDNKLEVECNGYGALFVEAFMDITEQEFLEVSNNPNWSWRKLLYRSQGASFLDIPPLVVQVTNLRSGGMILSLAINHCLCDGIGTSQFLHAWAHLTNKPTSTLLPLTPYHSRHLFNPRPPLTNNNNSIPGQQSRETVNITISHFNSNNNNNNNNNNSHQFNILKYLKSQPLVPCSLIFTPSLILQLKKQCSPSLKCTTFEVLASHTWRSWVNSLDLPSSLNVKLLFSINIRKRMKPELPQGYYGNAFVLACAESSSKELVNSNMHNLVKLVQKAKETSNDEYVRSIIDLMEDNKNVEMDLSTSLVISQWSKLGLEDLDFGQGKPSHMGSLTSDVYCLFLPVVGELDGVRVLVSMPESIVRKFEYHMMEFSTKEEQNG